VQRQNTLPATVGLCLSGGGFRAAAFHLGALTYLHRAGLLDRVRLLSTVSGGTFTGAKLTLAHLTKTPYADFFPAYYKELRDFRIFDKALHLLGGSEPLANASGRKNLITCAAAVYSTWLFQKPGGQPYFFEDVLNGNTTPLEEITFNTTDFRTGLAFRFQKSATTGLIGNLNTRLPPADAGQVRLGDIVAASSCFPGGFEPLVFPDDMAWKQKSVPPGILSLFANARSPLMDGGVYDNQGLESLLFADQRLRNAGPAGPAPNGADLIIISDTDRLSENLYQVPGPIRDAILQSKTNWALKLLFWIDPRLKWLDRGSWLLIVLCWLTIAAIAGNLVEKFLSPQAIDWFELTLTSVVPLALALASQFLVNALRGLVRKDLLPKIPQLQAAGWNYLREIPLSRALDMALFRVTSLLALTSEVFMKRIRSAGLNRTFDDPAYQGRIMANLIYQLTPNYRWVFAAPASDSKMLPGLEPALVAELQAIPPPSAQLEGVAKTAADMPTTLWFNDPKELPALVAAGQFTTCLNLMKFVARTRIFDANTRTFQGEVGPLWEQLLAEWKRFQSAPYFLLDEMIPEARKSPS
jgi:predicted acylesterase/phospholipase RssA